MTADETVLSLPDDQRRDVMKAPDEVSAMLRLKALGWGSKRIAAELGCARNTVRRWLNEGDWRACASASRSKKLDGLSDWIAERFHRHAGNADVVRQELAFEKGLVVSLRTAERATAPLRRELVAFRAFGGVPREVLLDNAKALILHHDPASREVVLHPRLHAFARHWGFRIRACAPYRARTKGKDERGVGYVKRNAIAGRRFVTWPAMEAHLEAWTREIADVRVHGTTGETPRERFDRAEAAALRSLAGTPPFMTARDLLRRVGADCAIEVDGNAYSVPWRLIGERVRVTVGSGAVRVLHAGHEVAVHAELKGRHGRSTDDQHLAGIAGTKSRPIRLMTELEAAAPEAPSALLRPLADYEAAIGGGF